MKIYEGHDKPICTIQILNMRCALMKYGLYMFLKDFVRTPCGNIVCSCETRCPIFKIIEFVGVNVSTRSNMTGEMTNEPSDSEASAVLYQQ